MKETSLCYIEKDGCYLMQHRVKKENDLNHEKWVGVGGKFEGEESPEECVLRETLEETGLTLTSYRYRAVITFISDQWEGEHMHLFTADGFTGEMLSECPEGELVWVPKDEVERLPIWEGDRLFFDYLKKDVGFFTMKLVYQGEKLVHHEERIYG
jgi:8-oxo-dGTP diphosphatase